MHAGSKVEARDWMPDEYRTSVLRFVEMHANTELMGVLPEREWIMRAPTLKRKLALTAKVQDECRPRPAALPRGGGPGQVARSDVQDLLDGKTKFHNVFHYPTKTWADVGIIAWLVDAAAILAQQALRDSSYGPYSGHDEEDLLGESVHIMHGHDVVVTMMNGSANAARMVQEALDRWWGPLMQIHGPRTDPAKDRDLYWRIKEKTSEQLRQEFLRRTCRGYRRSSCSRDPELKPEEVSGESSYTEPDWAGAALHRHRARSQEPGAIGVSAHQPRSDRVGAVNDPGGAGGRRMKASPLLLFDGNCARGNDLL